MNRPGPHRNRLVATLVTVIVLGGIALTLGLRKTVTLSLDGQSRQVTTYALTVGSLLHELGLPLSPADDLSPPQGAWLKNRSQVELVQAVPVQVLADNKITSLLCADRTPSGLLSLASVDLKPGDRVLSNGHPVDLSEAFPLASQSISLQLQRAVDFSLDQDGKEQSLSSIGTIVGAALWAAGYTYYAADQVTPSINEPLVPGMKVTVRTSRLVKVSLAGEVLTFRTAAATVGEALEQARLPIQGLDYSQPPVDSPVPAEGVIKVVRVSETVLSEQTPIPFETEFQPAPEVDLDSQSLLQAGEYGLTVRLVRVRYEDGVEISRQVETQWVAKQPIPRIIGYGTLIVMHTAVVDGVTIQYWRSLDMYATSYHPSEVGGTTASGEPLRKGVVAIDRSLIPFYTQLYIPGYGEAIAADIGGGVIGRMIDLGYSDDDYVPWHQWVTVYFLWPPPANIVWVIP